MLLVILPPFIYSAGVAMSWREFKFNLRPIGLLAFGCVIFTTCAIAAAVHYLLHFDWAVGFLLGAIISPTDVVAPLAIARQLGLPRRIIVVLEGEGLANDATALVLYKFAVVAISTGTFSAKDASVTFPLIVVGETLYGLAIGWLSLHLRRWAREPRVEITLSLMTPYLAFWVPAHLGGSGVLATVACGLYVSWNGPLLIPPATRLQGIFFWDLIVYLIEGLVFLVTGLQARTLIEQSARFFNSRIVGDGCLDHGDCDHRPLSLDFPGDLRSALGQPLACQTRSGTLLADAVFPVVYRHPWRGVARGCFGNSIYDCRWSTVSPPRSHPVCHFRGDHHHVDSPRHDAAVGCALAGIE